METQGAVCSLTCRRLWIAFAALVVLLQLALFTHVLRHDMQLPHTTAQWFSSSSPQYVFVYETEGKKSTEYLRRFTPGTAVEDILTILSNKSYVALHPRNEPDLLLVGRNPVAAGQYVITSDKDASQQLPQEKYSKDQLDFFTEKPRSSIFDVFDSSARPAPAAKAKKNPKKLRKIPSKSKQNSAPDPSKPPAKAYGPPAPSPVANSMKVQPIVSLPNNKNNPTQKQQQQPSNQQSQPKPISQPAPQDQQLQEQQKKQRDQQNEQAQKTAEEQGQKRKTNSQEQQTKQQEQSQKTSEQTEKARRSSAQQPKPQPLPKPQPQVQTQQQEQTTKAAERERIQLENHRNEQQQKKTAQAQANQPPTKQPAQPKGEAPLVANDRVIDVTGGRLNVFGKLPPAPLHPAYPPMPKVKTEDVVMLTAVDSQYYHGLKEWIASLQFWEPNRKLLVYDLGLGDDQRQIISTWCNVELMPKPEVAFPDLDVNVFKRGKEYAWKGPCIRHALLKYKAVFYVDGGCSFRGPLQPLLDVLVKDGFVLMKGQDNDFSNRIHPNSHSVLNGPPIHLMRNLPSFAGGIQGWVINNPMQDVFDQYYHCCINKSCITPKGSSLTNHRYDQSVLSLSAYMLHGVEIPHWTDYLAYAQSQLSKDITKPSKMVIWTARGGSTSYIDRLKVCAKT